MNPKPISSFRQTFIVRRSFESWRALIILGTLAVASSSSAFACGEEQLAGLELGHPMSLMQRLQRRPAPNASMIGDLGGRHIFVLAIKDRGDVDVTLNQNDEIYSVASSRRFKSIVDTQAYFEAQSVSLAAQRLELHPASFDGERNEFFTASNGQREVLATVHELEVQWACTDLQLAKQADDLALENEISRETEKNKQRNPSDRIWAWQIRSRQARMDERWLDVLAIYDAARSGSSDQFELDKLNAAWQFAQQRLADQLLRTKGRSVAVAALVAAAKDDRWSMSSRGGLWNTIVNIYLHDSRAALPNGDWVQPLKEALAIPDLPADGKARLLMSWQGGLLGAKRYGEVLQKGAELQALPDLRPFYQVYGRMTDAVAQARMKNESAKFIPPQAIGNFVKPVYPRRAMRDGVEGKVSIDFAINAQGQVADVVIGQSSGNFELDNAALRSARSMSFAPGTLEGQPMDMVVAMPVEFKLTP